MDQSAAPMARKIWKRANGLAPIGVLRLDAAALGFGKDIEDCRGGQRYSQAIRF
jgi:hypothetical protein